MNQILEIFIKEPEREFHVREIAKLLKVTTSTANIYLLELQLEKKLNRKDIPRKDYNYKIWSIKK